MPTVKRSMFLQIYIVIAFFLEIKEWRGGGVYTCGQIRVGMATCNQGEDFLYCVAKRNEGKTISSGASLVVLAKTSLPVEMQPTEQNSISFIVIAPSE